MKKILFIIGPPKTKSFNLQLAEIARRFIGSRAETTIIR